MVGDVANAPVCTGKLDEVRVYSYNGNALDNFQVYHTDTTWQLRPPCTPTTRPEIDGLLCPIAPLAALSTPTRFAKAGVELAESGLNRIQVAMRKLFTAPTDTLVAMRRLFSTPADTSAMVCRATPPSM
jgi:hypothetical protein